MGLTFFEQRRRLLARQIEMEEVDKKAVEEPVTESETETVTEDETETVTEDETETVTEDETTEDSKPKKAVKGKE